jgi:gamma-glutamylcyclotransferase (GGCT)/AIG2-like uncharacterized protein YtfP
VCEDGLIYSQIYSENKKFNLEIRKECHVTGILRNVDVKKTLMLVNEISDIGTKKKKSTELERHIAE